MAELAIPIVLLGGLYVVAKNKPKAHNEGFLNKQDDIQENATNDVASVVVEKATIPDTITVIQREGREEPSLEKLAASRNKNVNEYDGLIDSRGQFHSKALYRDGVKANEGARLNHKLTGEAITPENFKHNNMVPFFGSMVRGVQPDANVHEGLMDTKQGAGSLRIEKKETGSFFKNQEGFTNIYGAPNQNDFYMQRMAPSMRMEKTMPFEPERVGGAHENAAVGEGGFNSGMRMREAWMPRGVDDLRVASNKKATELRSAIGAPAGRSVQNLGKIGRVEKHGPDTYFEYTPDLWSAGINHEMMGPTMRNDPGVKDAAGLEKNFDHGTQLLSGSAPVKNAYGNRNYMQSKRQTGLSQTNPELSHLQVNRAKPAPGEVPDSDQHIYGGMTHKSTYRAVTYDDAMSKGETFMGQATGALRELVAPLKHIIKPTQKEEIFLKHRELSNYKQLVQNPEARDFEYMQAPTNREILEGRLGMSHVQSQSQQTHPSRDKKYSLGTIREELERSYVGGASGSRASGKADNHHLNQYQTPGDKTIAIPADRPLGNANIFSPTINARTEKMEPLQVQPRFESAMIHSAIPSVHTFGVTNAPFSLSEKSTVDERLNADLLDAFRKNPYTHSLSSIA
jgi:hypothetical protein